MNPIRLTTRRAELIHHKIQDAYTECIIERRRYCVINHPLIPKGELYKVFGIMMRGK